MEVEIRLKKILKAKGLLTRGVYTRIADDLGVNWRTIKNICDNKCTTISLAMIARLCYWLEQNDMGEGLPGALFGYRPPCLAQALGEPGLVTIYMGEYRPAEEPAVSSPWLSRDDSAVGAAVVELLSKSPCRGRGVRFNHVFVPFHFSRDEDCVRQHLACDAAVARDRFERMRHPSAEGSSILIGSQIVNYMLELFVADLFDCKPFEPATGRPPFYVRYRMAKAPSCFGGIELPPGCTKDGGPGIYFRRKDGGWEVRPSSDNRDCGMVILRRDPGEARVELAIFGHCGRGTNLMGKVLREEPDIFWRRAEKEKDKEKEKEKQKETGLEVRAYLVSFELARLACTKRGGPTHRVRERHVEEIDLGEAETMFGMDTMAG